jgi:hypothetical protein
MQRRHRYRRWIRIGQRGRTEWRSTIRHIDDPRCAGPRLARRATGSASIWLPLWIVSLFCALAGSVLPISAITAMAAAIVRNCIFPPS